MQRNIVLIGMPGSGKTVIGRLLAKELNMPYIDADVMLESLAGEKIPTLFEQGEEVFRDWETKVCEELSHKSGTVIATGGGVVKRGQNMELLRENGIIVFLDRSPEDIVGDVDCSGRPLLKGGLQRVYELYGERIDLYRQYSDITVVNNATRGETASAIVSKVTDYLWKGWINR